MLLLDWAKVFLDRMLKTWITKAEGDKWANIAKDTL